MFRRTPLALITAAVTLLLCAMPALATGRPPIIVKGSIQDAIDAANPGDTIFVPRGTYAECPVVAKSGLTIVGSRDAVIDATGCRRGLSVGTGSITTDPGTGLPVCPPTMIDGFTLKGLTIKNADFTGVFLIGVTNFHVTGGRYVANAEYGIFPRCSSHGLIDWNVVDGAEIAEDAAGPWEGTRVMFLQHPSDPIIWWSPDLLFSRPDWLIEPAGHDRSAAILPWCAGRGAG